MSRSRSNGAEQEAVVSAARELGERLAGLWVEDGHQVVAVTSDPLEAAARFAEVAPGCDVAVIELPHSLAALERLHDEIVEAAEALGADFASVGVDEKLNLVEVTLRDLEAPASLELQARFAERPTTWRRGDVRAADA